MCYSPPHGSYGSLTRPESALQQPFSCTPTYYDAVEAVLSSARLARYLPEAKGDKHYALRLYVWNARLCEEFYLPLQIAEVAIRNAIHGTLVRRFKTGWHSDQSFTSQLNDKFRDELAYTVAQQRASRGSSMTDDHVVQGMTFGFWVYLLTARFEPLLWQGGMFRSFPNAGRAITRQDIHDRVDRLRVFRNKTAHHMAIFDKTPRTEYDNLKEILSFICDKTVWFSETLSNPVRVITRKPRY